MLKKKKIYQHTVNTWEGYCLSSMPKKKKKIWEGEK